MLGSSFMTSSFTMLLHDQTEALERQLQRVHDKWELSKTLPRKKKKAMRKEVQLDYSLYLWQKEILGV